MVLSGYHGSQIKLIYLCVKIELYKEEVKKTEQTASNLEQENIDLMAYLFECNNEEVNYVR